MKNVSREARQEVVEAIRDRYRVTLRLDHVKSGELKFTSQTRKVPSVLVRNVTNG